MNKERLFFYDNILKNMSCGTCDLANCWGRIGINTLFSTGLAALLFPGAILSIPPISKNDPEFIGKSLGKRMFFTRKVTWGSILFHMFVYFITIFAWFVLVSFFWYFIEFFLS